MKPGLKKVFVWSSLGSLALGAAVALAYRKKKPPLLVYHKIPADITKVTIWTAEFEASEETERQRVRDQYVLQRTPFKLWSVLDLDPENPAGESEGILIYHVTHWRILIGEGAEEQRMKCRLYGTLSSARSGGRAGPKNHIARGGILAIHECRVGGAANGVETGDIHYSGAPILNYRFDYPPA